MKQNNILGIDPGSRHIGVSVFQNGNLSYYAIRTIERNTKQETLQKLQRIIKKLILNYGITHLAIEEVFYIQQKRSFVKRVYEEIKSFSSERSDINLLKYKPKDIRQTISDKEKIKGDAIKDNVNRFLISKFPELQKYLNLPNRSQVRYYDFLFGAIAVGLVCVWELEIDNEEDESRR